MRTLLSAAFCAAALAAAGCGGGTTDVSGKVTFQGKPVVYGTVVVVGADGTPKAGTINPDGTYTVSGVKVGPARIAVSSPAPPGSEAAAKKAKAGRDADDEERTRPDVPPADPEVVKKWFPLPAKYGEPTTSGLTADVKPGQPVDLDLK